MMSKMKAKSPKKPSSKIWCVDVYEHERGWGQRLEDHFKFPSEAAAAKYASEANFRFREQGDDECFALAHPPYVQKNF